MRAPLLRPPKVYPFRRYEKALASLLLAGIVTGSGLGLRRALTPTQPEPDTRICFNIGLVFGWDVWCWDSNKPKKVVPPDDPQPCPTPTPTCDPQTQSCP